MHEVAPVDAQHLGELEDVVQGGVALSPFDLAEVAPVQARLLSKLLLALSELMAAHLYPLPNWRVASEIGSLGMADRPIGSDARTGGRAVAICFTYLALLQQHGHLFHLDFSRPTKDVRVHFAYRGCGIRHVNLLDYIASSLDTALSRLPASGPTPSIAVRFDGWALPKAGIGFVWVLESELGAAATDGRPAGTPDARA